MPYNNRTNKGTPMITDEQILELAEQFLEEWGANDQDGNTWKEYSGTTKDIIEFARAIYEMGNDTLTVSQPTSTISQEQSINRVER
jgi:hypothetical protein